MDPTPRNHRKRHPHMHLMHRVLFLTPLLAAALILAACSRNLSDANLRAVKAEMSAKEVESILGQPDRIETAPEEAEEVVRQLPVTRYLYQQNGRDVELTFINGRLAPDGIKGSFENE